MESQELFNKYTVGRHWDYHPTVYAEFFADILKAYNISGVVDLGCGSGRDVNVFASRGLHATGIDYDIREIKRAREIFPSLDFRLGNVERLDFPDYSIDAFFMINVIHYVDKEKALAELLRTLKPEGYLYIHFNMNIVDAEGTIDYNHDEGGILQLVSKTNILHKTIFERVDTVPFEHTHTILELIAQKT